MVATKKMQSIVSTVYDFSYSASCSFFFFLMFVNKAAFNRTAATMVETTMRMVTVRAKSSPSF